MEERRVSVAIYESWHNYLKSLGPEKYVEGMELIMNYALDGKLPETDEPLLFGFMWGIMPLINTNNKKYQASIKRRQAKKGEKTDGKGILSD